MSFLSFGLHVNFWRHSLSEPLWDEEFKMVTLKMLKKKRRHLFEFLVQNWVGPTMSPKIIMTVPRTPYFAIYKLYRPKKKCLFPVTLP